MTSVKTPESRSPIVQYTSLFLAIIFFSGIFKTGMGTDILKFLDFSNILGAFGSVAEAGNFVGKGGTGARQGYIFAISLIPATMTAMAFIALFEHFGALEAARKSLTPILRFLMGIPGISSIALLASLQSTDSGAALTRGLVLDNQLNHKEKTIFAAFQFSAGAAIVNFFSSGAPLLLLTDENGMTAPITIGTVIVVMLVFKILGANLMRFFLYKALLEKNSITRTEKEEK